MGRGNIKFVNPAFLTGVVVLVAWCVVTVLWPVAVIYYFLVMGLLFASYGTFCSIKGRMAKFKVPAEVVRKPNEASSVRSVETFKSKWFEAADDLPSPPLTRRKANPSMDL